MALSIQLTLTLFTILLSLRSIIAHSHHSPPSSDEPPLSFSVGPNYPYPLEDLDKDLPFSQPVTFAHLPWHRCFSPAHTSPLDIAIVGFGFVEFETSRVRIIPTGRIQWLTSRL